MTPKEKAEELRVKIFECSFEKYAITAVALVCVDEILEYSKENDAVRDLNGDPYWQQVKEEIKKL